MKIREARKKKGFTQMKVAKLLGVNQNTYSYWENGKTKIDHFTLAKLAEVFEVSTDFLLGIENKTKHTLLRQIRDYFNITQEELSSIANVPLNDIAAWENGSQEISLESIFHSPNAKQNPRNHKSSKINTLPHLNNKYKQKKIPIIGTEIWNAKKLNLENFNYINKMFALRCNNSSLEKFKIFIDDYVIIQKQNHANNKQMVAVIIDDRIQIRRYLENNNIIILESGDENCETIAFMAQDLQKIKIIGIVLEVIRIF